jgi:hypothetical protein
MMKKFLAPFVALALVACAGIPVVSTQAPAPLAQTKIDDTGLEVAWKALDTALDGINLALDLKPALIGTPGANRVADAIDAATAALSAAEAAAAAGSTTSYATAMAKAKEALTEMRVALQSLKGN